MGEDVGTVDWHCWQRTLVDYWGYGRLDGGAGWWLQPLLGGGVRRLGESGAPRPYHHTKYFGEEPFSSVRMNN